MWLDFCCIDQDGAPSSELEQLGALISLCDLVLVPVIDHNHREWSIPAAWSNEFEEYKAAGWTEYWGRAWCRVEAMLAAVKPVVDHAERATLFRGAMGNAIAAGRRPWALFGTKEQEELVPPLFLPPLANSTFDKYSPQGELTKETDRGLIETLEADARKDVVPIEVGYVGEEKDGKPHGRGKSSTPTATCRTGGGGPEARQGDVPVRQRQRVRGAVREGPEARQGDVPVRQRQRVRGAVREGQEARQGGRSGSPTATCTRGSSRRTRSTAGGRRSPTATCTRGVKENKKHGRGRTGTPTATCFTTASGGMASPSGEP